MTEKCKQEEKERKKRQLSTSHRNDVTMICQFSRLLLARCRLTETHDFQEIKTKGRKNIEVKALCKVQRVHETLVRF